MRIKQNEELNIKPEQVEELPGGLPAFDPENPSDYLSHCPQDDNGNRIVPDDIFNSFCKYLPDGTFNASRTYRAYNGGRLYQIGSDPDKDREVTIAGANASNATQAQRRSFRETFDTLLRKRADTETIAALNLDSTATNQDAIAAAMAIEARNGNTKAAQFIRDTIGEMPTIKQEVTADILTAEDRELLEKIRNRQQDERRNDRKTVQNPADNTEANS